VYSLTHTTQPSIWLAPRSRVWTYKPPRSLPPAKLGTVYFSLSSWFSLHHYAKAFKRYLFTMAFYFSLSRGREHTWHLPYVLQEFTTWLWQGRTPSCWMSPAPGACAGWWKAGVQSIKSVLPVQVFPHEAGVCCSNCAYPVSPTLPLEAHTALPLGSILRRTLSVHGPVRAQPDVGVGWWYWALQPPPTRIGVEMGRAVSESGSNPTSDLRHLCNLGCVIELSWIKWGRESPHHGTVGRFNEIMKVNLGCSLL